MIAIVIGFFATAGAAGADFGMNARDEKRRADGAGWWVSRWPRMVAGGLPLMSVAGAHGSESQPGWDYRRRDQAIGGPIASAMFFLFAIASIPPPASAPLSRATASIR